MLLFDALCVEYKNRVKPEEVVGRQRSQQHATDVKEADSIIHNMEFFVDTKQLAYSTLVH